MLFTSRLLPANCLGLLDHFVGLVLKGLKDAKESHQKNNYPAQKMIKENENEQNRMNYYFQKYFCFQKNYFNPLTINVPII